MKNLVVLDVECYPNYFLISFKGLNTGKVVTASMFGERATLSPEQRARVRKVLSTRTTFGYNSIRYDIPMIHCALNGSSCMELYEISKGIIENNKPEWMTYREQDIRPMKIDHFDISEPSPAVMISLKNYGTRVGSKKLWDLPYDPHTVLTQSQADVVEDYCENDLDVTIDLYNAISDRIELRVAMSKQYGIDLRSKSDAQIAEGVITSELAKLGVEAVKPSLSSVYSAKYHPPEFIKFESDDLNNLLQEIKGIKFTLQANGSVKIPTELANRKIVIGGTTYKMGIGGLHSQEKKMSIVSNETHVMRNADFTSYYPFIILLLGLFPKHLTSKFLTVYRNIVETRLKAKAEGNKLVADSLKITINGSFGKFGSKYSKLYSPDLLLATTITGQLTLLMLIEQLEKHGIGVVSANTDGLEYFCPRDKIDLAEAIIFDLELATGFEMEHGEYKALHARDVNNYVAVYDGYTKAKGVYAETTLSKGLQTPVVFEAVRGYLLSGKSMEDTIRSCCDMNKFCSARTVKGGGVYDGEYLGKMVRWYYSTESKGYISYKLNGNKVPKTDGCKPIMDLPDDNTIEKDVDYQWYIDEAKAMLKDLGVDYAD